MGAVDLFELACLEVGAYQHCRAIQVISHKGSQMEEITSSIKKRPGKMSSFSSVFCFTKYLRVFQELNTSHLLAEYQRFDRSLLDS